jgi:hypothetical protein
MNRPECKKCGSPVQNYGAVDKPNYSAYCESCNEANARRQRMAKLSNDQKKCESKFDNQEQLLEAYRIVVSDMNARIMELESDSKRFPKAPKFHLVVA